VFPFLKQERKELAFRKEQHT